MGKERCEAAWLGCVPYAEAWSMQEMLAGEIARGERPPAFMLLEHPHTFTAGRSTKAGHILWNEEERQKNNVALFDVDRGGDVTYHGPGQLVGYPLFKLPALTSSRDGSASTDTIGFVRKIEQALMSALSHFGIPAQQKPGFTGVWVKPRSGGAVSAETESKKIASIGVKVDVNRITRHGFALNVHPDMSYWNGIIACGLRGVAMTSMAEWNNHVPAMAEVVEAVIDGFTQVFDYEIIKKPDFFTQKRY